MIPVFCRRPVCLAWKRGGELLSIRLEIGQTKWWTASAKRPELSFSWEI